MRALIRGAVVVVGLLVIGGGAYYLFFGNAALAGLDITVEEPPQIFAGEPFPLTVSLSNASDRILSNASIALLLPEGVVFAGAGSEVRVAEESVGDVGPGSIAKREFTVIAIRDPQSLKRVEAKVRYRTAGSRTAFEYAETADLSIGPAAVDLSFSAPDTVFSGEEVEIVVKYANNASRDVKNLRLTLDYPPVFQFQRSEPDPAGTGNREWDLGTLTPGEASEVRLFGTMAGPEGMSFTFQATLKAEALGERYDMRVETAAVRLKSSPLSLTIEVNDGENTVARLDDEMTYVLRYRNNSSVTLERLTAKAVLAGEMFNLPTVRAAGAFDSLRNTISWNTANVPALAAVPPGGEGEVEFSVDVKSAFPIRRLSDKNFTLKVHAEIESRTVPPDTQAAKTIAVANVENRVAGRTTVAAKGYFRDAASGIVNSGPFPPRVDRTTQYTIHWIVQNYATDVSDVKVSTFLQSGARMAGVVKSTIDAKPTYRSDTGEVTWSIGRIPAGVGVVTSPIEAIFQIEQTPAVNQIGKDLVLVEKTALTGMDLFVNEEISAEDERITTDLPDDPTVQGGETSVQP